MHERVSEGHERKIVIVNKVDGVRRHQSNL